MILKDKISVVIQCYNQENYISDCIDSVLMQNQEIIGEIIIFDDCSTDNTRKILVEKYRNENKINLHLNSKNIGAFNTFRRMHQLARCKYIAHLDGDDIWSPEKLLKQYEVLEKNFSLVACGVAAKILTENNTVGINQIPNNIITNPTIEDIFTQHPRFILSSLMYRNHIFSWEELSEYQCFDWGLFLLLRSKGAIQVISTPMLSYRMGVGISTQKDLYDYEVGAINLGLYLGISKRLCELKYSEVVLNRIKRIIKNRKLIKKNAIPRVNINKIHFIIEFIKYTIRKIIN